MCLSCFRAQTIVQEYEAFVRRLLLVDLYTSDREEGREEGRQLFDTPFNNENAREEQSERGREAPPLSLFQMKSFRVLLSSLPLGKPTKGVARIATALTYRTPTSFHGRWQTLLSWGVGDAVG